MEICRRNFNWWNSKYCDDVRNGYPYKSISSDSAIYPQRRCCYHCHFFCVLLQQEKTRLVIVYSTYKAHRKLYTNTFPYFVFAPPTKICFIKEIRDRKKTDAIMLKIRIPITQTTGSSQVSIQKEILAFQLISINSI